MVTLLGTAAAHSDCKLQQLFGTAQQDARAPVMARSTLLKTIARISTMPRPRSTVKQARVQPVTAKSPTHIDREGGKRLRALREEAGMSQTALAERAGITFQQVQKYENGVNRVSISRLIQFCEALYVPPSQVLDGLSTARQPKTDPLQPLRTERGVRLARYGTGSTRRSRQRYSTSLRRPSADSLAPVLRALAPTARSTAIGPAESDPSAQSRFGGR